MLNSGLVVLVIAGTMWVLSLLALIVTKGQGMRGNLILLAGVIAGSLIAIVVTPQVGIPTIAGMVVLNSVPTTLWFIKRQIA